MRTGWPAVEADHALQPQTGGRLQEADPAAEAEAGGVQPVRRPALGRAQVGHRGRHVVHDSGRSELHDVRLVLEALAALGRLGGAAEQVDGHGVDARLGEAQAELLVVRMQATHVGDDHDAGAGRLNGARGVGEDGGAVAAGQGEASGVDGSAADRWPRGSGVGVEAHGSLLRQVVCRSKRYGARSTRVTTQYASARHGSGIAPTSSAARPASTWLPANRRGSPVSSTSWRSDLRTTGRLLMTPGMVSLGQIGRRTDPSAASIHRHPSLKASTPSSPAIWPSPYGAS